MKPLPAFPRVRLPSLPGALLLALVLVGLPPGALAQEDTNVQHIRDNFFKLGNAVRPPHCQGKWCVVMVSHCCISGSTIYQLYLRDPAGNVTEVGGRIGSEPEFVLDDQGRFKLDDPMAPWSGIPGVDAQEQEAPAPETEPSQKARQAALAACKKASPSCATQFTSTKGTCNRRGCVLSTSHQDTAPYCFMWREAGSGKMDLLGVYAEDFGYSGPDYVLDPNAVSVVGSGCKNGCSEADTALLRWDTLRRIADPGEIPQSASAWKDTAPITPVTGFRLRHVVHGVFSWNNALDAAARWQLVLLPDHVQLEASVVDDVLELEPCAAGKRPAVKCDHLELVVEDGPAKGAMVSILLSPGGTARVERWREPGGQDVQQPLETKRCSWSRVKKKQAAEAVHEFTVRCEVPREVLWGEGSSRSLSLRYSDAEQGRQQSVISVTQQFRASSEYPPAFVPKVGQCASDAAP